MKRTPALPVLIALLLGSGAAHAQSQSLGIVDDMELAGMRGKFVSQGQVIGFGLQMLTRWQTSDGGLREASLSVVADLRGAGKSTVQASAVSQGGTAQASSGVASALLPSVAGTYQSMHVAGDANDVSNRMEIQVHRGEVRIDAAPGAPVARAAGAVAEVTPSGVARVRVDTPVGFAEQRLGPTAGPSQVSVVTGVGASVQNLTRLSVNLGSSAPAPGAAFEALRAMPLMRR